MIAFLALNAGAALLALLLAFVVGFGERPGRFTFAVLGGYLIVVHSIVLVTGLAGHLTVLAAGVVLGGALAVMLAFVAGAGFAPAMRVGDERRLEPAPVVSPTRLVTLAAVVALAVWAWPHVVSATRLWVWDDYTYHMVYPALWLQERTIAAPTPVQAFTMQAWYPLSASVVSTWFTLPFHGVPGAALAWVSLTAVLYTAIVAAGAAELFARLGRAGDAWAVPVVLFVTSHRIGVMASSFSDADLAHAAALFAAFVFAVPRGDAEGRRDVVADTWYAGLLSGIALGVKVSAAPQALIVLLMTALRGAARAERRSAKARAAARTALVFGAAWTATAGYWYARNIVHTGNPVYPAAFLVWPGVTFPETTLVEYGRRYGVQRAVVDALAVYLSWPLLHAVLALAGLAGLVGWLVLRSRAAPRPRRYFAWGTLALAGSVLILLPPAPYSAGNAMTFRSGFVHWDSMRYVALVPILGWMALGFSVTAGAARAARWRALATGLISVAALLAAEEALAVSGPVLIALATAAALLWSSVSAFTTWRLRTGRHQAFACGLIVLVSLGFLAGMHRAKAAATEASRYDEPLFGAAAAVLDRQPAASRVAVFGDQWIYPAFGDRAHLRPVRLDRDGRVATAPIGAAMEPGELTVDPATFRENLKASAVDVVVLVRQPHPGRPSELPTQHTALEAVPDAHLLHRDRAVAIWRLR